MSPVKVLSSCDEEDKTIYCEVCGENPAMERHWVSQEPECTMKEKKLVCWSCMDPGEGKAQEPGKEGTGPAAEEKGGRCRRGPWMRNPAFVACLRLFRFFSQ